MSLQDTTDITGSQTGMDYWLLGSALVLAGLGLIMVLSASGVMAERAMESKYFYFRKQAVYALVGLVVMVVFARMPKRVMYAPVYLWLFAVIGLLFLTLIPPFSVKAGGARRWLSLGGVSIQPMELAKVALVFYLAYFFSQKQKLVRSFSVGFIPPVVVTGGLGLVLLWQPDFGGAVFLGMLFFLMSLVGGTRLTYLFVSVLFGAAAMGLLIVQSPYRFKRWFAFLDPFKDPQNVGYQLVQSFYAFGSGGVAGAGFGAGKQKLFYLPEAHTDFVMAVLGEEMGFLGVTIVFLCIGILLWRSFRIALSQDDLRDRFTAYGMSLVLGLGFLLNLAVVLGCVPPKGVAMPFLSYGGSSLVACFLCVGVLLNLSRRRAS
ncbi:MAG: putative lipid II flippase FtsW [Desulfovibrio sp.]|nr:putative lipid II flippase FtsW [Desulfovibrio sp.]